jgi:hypothetical protein
MTDERNMTLDDRLADFTDRLMAGETAEQAAASDAGRELASLQETVERTRRVLQAPQPDSSLQNRIRSRLAAEWLKTGPQAQGKRKEWTSPGKRNQVFLLRLTVVVALLAIAAVLVAPKIDTFLTGAAQNQGGVMLIGGVILIILILILIWPSRKS